jgi:hypothetical protein
MRTISRCISILALACGLFAISGLGIAGQVSCPANQRELLLTNSTSQDIWIGGGGGALRSVCVVDQNNSCLAALASINPSTGACSCGTQQGTLACPGIAQSTGSGTNGGLNCACTMDSDCVREPDATRTLTSAIFCSRRSPSRMPILGNHLLGD